MSRKPAKQARNLGVMLLAGVLAFLFGALAVYLFSGAQSWDIVYGIACSIIAILSLVVFAYGRIAPLKYLAEAIIGLV